MAITRLWFFTLQPNHTATDPAFLSLWADILELCARYTPAPAPAPTGVQIQLALAPRPARPHHFLLQQQQQSRPSASAAGGGDDDEEEGALLVFVSSYPSLALCRQADAAYAARYKKDVLAHVRHRALRQLDIEDAEVVPALIAPRARSCRGGKGRQGEQGAGKGKGEEEEDDDDDEGVTVTITNRNPLRTEIDGLRSGLGSGKRAPVLPPNQEISGADVFEMPPVPRDGRPDAFEKQRQEGKRWIRIRRGLPKIDDEVIEVFQLKELLSR